MDWSLRGPEAPQPKELCLLVALLEASRLAYNPPMEKMALDLGFGPAQAKIVADSFEEWERTDNLWNSLTNAWMVGDAADHAPHLQLAVSKALQLWQDCATFAARFEALQTRTRRSIDAIYGDDRAHVSLPQLVKALFPSSAKSTLVKLEEALRRSLEESWSQACKETEGGGVDGQMVQALIEAFDDPGVGRADALWLIPLIQRVYQAEYSPTARGKKAAAMRQRGDAGA